MRARFTRRGFLASLLGVGSGILVASCQQQATPPSASPQVVEVTRVVEKEVQVTTVVQVTPTPGRSRLVYWDWWARNTPQQKQWWDWIEGEFKAKYPNIDYEFQNVPFGEYMTKFLTAYAGGVPPDAMASSVDWGATLWDRGAIRDLGDYIRNSTLIRMDNYAQSSIDFVTQKGHTFGVPASGPDSYILIGNQAILKEKGVDLQKLTTYDALVEAALALTERDASGEVTRAGFLLSSIESLDKIFVWLITNGATLYDREQTRVVFNTEENRPKSLEALHFLLALQYEHKVSRPFEAGRDTTALFSQGKAAIVEGGNWNLARYKEQFPDLDLDIIMYPAGPQGAGPTTHTWTNMQVLPSNTKNPDGGWAFVELHSSTPSLIKRMQLMGEIGPPLDLFKSPEFTELTSKVPALAKYPAILQAGQALDYRKYKEVEQVMVPHFQAVMLQQATPEDALGAAEAAANEVLAQP